MKSWLRKPALVALGLATLCGLAETIFYGGRLDANNVLQESLFMPLTFIFAFIGIAFGLVSLPVRRS